MTEPPAHVMLVDDHDLFRAGLRKLLEGEGIRVVADTVADDRVLDLARRTRPTCVLVDITRGDGSNAPLIRSLLEENPDLAVLVFTKSLRDVDVHEALRAGARGYVMKETPIAELAGAVRSVLRGNACLSPQAASIVVGFVRTGSVPSSVHAGMSDRELDVLRLMARGLDNNQIATELSISAKTVKNHVSSIFTKLQMTNRVQAAVYAVRAGLA